MGEHHVSSQRKDDHPLPGGFFFPGRVPLSDYYNYGGEKDPRVTYRLGAAAELDAFGRLGRHPAPRQPCWRGTLDPVDQWPMATDQQTNSGEGLSRKPLSGVNCGRYPPLAGCMSHRLRRLRVSWPCAADHLVGNSVGANGWWRGARGLVPRLQAAVVRICLIANT